MRKKLIKLQTNTNLPIINDRADFKSSIHQMKKDQYRKEHHNKKKHKILATRAHREPLFDAQTGFRNKPQKSISELTL